MLRKKEKFTIDVFNEGFLSERVGSVEYQMPAKTAEEILKARKGTDKNMHPQAYLIKYANENLGLLRNCTKVTIV